MLVSTSKNSFAVAFSKSLESYKPSTKKTDEVVKSHNKMIENEKKSPSPESQV